MVCNRAAAVLTKRSTVDSCGRSTWRGQEQLPVTPSQGLAQLCWQVTGVLYGDLLLLAAPSDLSNPTDLAKTRNCEDGNLKLRHKSSIMSMSVHVKKEVLSTGIKVNSSKAGSDTIR